MQERFTKKNCKKQIQKIEKRKGDDLNVKQKSDDNSFDNWIDKKDRVK